MVEGKEITVSLGAVAAEPEEAARIGARTLERGGNAMDAAAATCVACGVLEPEAVDLGGYLFCAVVLEGRSDRIWCLDANSVAPGAAHDQLYQVKPARDKTPGLNAQEYQCHVKDDANLYGPLAVGVPGFAAGVGFLWERWGRLKWDEIIAPSLGLLNGGFPYGSTADAIQRMANVVRRFEPTARHLMPNGSVPKAEDIWFRPGLEKTLERLASVGWRDFYEGEIGRKIADCVASAGGILTQADMAQFFPRVTEPFTTTYRDAKVYGASLPNGGLSALQALNMLERFDPLPDCEVVYWHRLAEVLKLAWRDRLRNLGDPDFVSVPVQKLLSKDYAAGRTEALIDFPDRADGMVLRPEAATNGTAHVAAADSAGNMVSATISIGGLFGSCVTVPGSGIILGHGMCRFDPRPGRPNSVAPRKRPLNNAAPAILRMLGRDAATGLRGGRRIVSVSAQLCHRMVDFEASSLEVATAPRMHVETGEPIVLQSVDPSIVDALAGMGHSVKTVRNVGGAAHSVEFLKGQARIRAGGNVWAAGF